MFGPLLRKTAIIIFVCNIFAETQDSDFLEYYKPKPGLPKELNEWLSDVQQYKGDFRLIRAIAEKQEKDGLDYDTDNLANTNTKLFDNLEDENEYLDEAPKNDIYPHMYKQKKNPYENFGTSFDKPSKNRKYAPKNPRQRRHSDRDSLFDKRDIYINPKSDDGEIKRSDDKYPDRFFNNLKENVNQKREIQIDVLNDGKLVKQIRENDKDPKSIVLNIQSLDKFRNPPPAYKPEPMSIENEANQLRPQDSQVKVFPVQRNADPEPNNKEFSNNFRNLFSANENLNTDSSIAREKLGQTALLYRVTLPDPDNLFLPDQDKITVKEDNQSGYNHNGMKDMSQFWTATEKYQMQKGIEFARGNWNGKPIINTQQATDNDGFELVKSVVIDTDNLKDNYIKPKKRESQTIEGRVRINAGADNKNVVYNADVKSSKGAFDSYMPVNENQDNEEKRINTEERNTTPNIVLIDSQTGSKIMEGAIESIQSIDEHVYGPDNIEPKEEPNLSIPLEGNSLEDNAAPDASIDDKLNGDIDKIEVMAESNNVEELIPEEYRETTTEFLIPAPEGEHNVENVDDIWMGNEEEKRMKPVDQLGEQLDTEQIDGTRVDNNGKDGDEPVEIPEEKIDESIVHKENEYNGVEATELSEKNHEKVKPNHNHQVEEGSDAKETGENIHEHEHELNHNNHEQKFNHHQKHLNVEGIDSEEEKSENIHEPQLENGRIDTGETKEIFEEPKMHCNGKIHPNQNHLTDESIDTENKNGDKNEPKVIHLENEGIGNGETNAVNLKPYEEHQLPNYNYKEKQNHHLVNTFPLTRIHKVDEHIHDHLVVTRIETVTVLDQNRMNEGKEQESGEPPNLQEAEAQENVPEIVQKPHAKECSGNMNKHHKTVKIFTRPLRKHHNMKEREKFSLNRAQLETKKTNRLSMKECEGDTCAEEEDNMEPVAERKNTDTKKKKHKKRKHKSYRDKIRYNVGRDDNDEFLPNDYEDIPAFGRHLQGVEYVYDVDLGPREIAPTDVKEVISTERSKRVGMLHKDSVEGDYGDEEDSITKEKKIDSKLVKKTDNEFANPVDTTTEEDDDDEEYYEDAAESKKNAKSEDDTHEQLASFGRRLHKQNKPPSKEDKDEKLVKPKAKKIREAPSQRFLDKSEFQRWPQFVISDKVNEENLRKRSLAVKNMEPKRNIFPLSSKDYFTKSKSKRRDNSPLDVFDKIMHANKSTTEKPFFDFDKPIKDNDMEVKLNLNLNMDDKNPKNGGLNDDLTLFPVSTVATTANQSAVSVTTEDEGECDSETPKVSVGNVCEENENFNKTKVALTTVLSIIPDTQGEISNETYTSDDFVKLDDILTGRLPFKIVEYIRGHIKKDRNLRDRFLKGMKKGHGEEAFQNLPDVTNDETKKLINAMATLMNRLQITSTCQTLPGKLLRYLKSATRVRLEDALARAKEMEEVEFDDIQNQDTFIFQSNSRADNLEEKVRVLKDLLAKYNHLPDRCKPRAEPVREYVLNHLKLLTNMLSVAQLSPPRPKKTVQGPTEEDSTQPPIGEPPEKKTTERDLVEQQLESLGLGKRHNFRPKFSLDELIEHNRNAKEISVDETRLRPGGNKKNKRDLDTREQISEKYEKLRQAVKKERTKRDSERRVAENFGRLSVEDYNGEGVDREGTGSFESPLVFSF